MAGEDSLIFRVLPSWGIRHKPSEVLGVWAFLYSILPTLQGREGEKALLCSSDLSLFS